MEFFEVTPPFESADKILWYDHIQMKSLWLYLHLALFDFQNLRKWNWNIWLKFAFG